MGNTSLHRGCEGVSVLGGPGAATGIGVGLLVQTPVTLSAANW